ncbi:MAG: S-methyl-5-thioribose kinase, partial [Pseudomonadota bacterium]
MTIAPPPPGYAPHSPETLPAYLASVPGLGARLGPDPDAWTVQEVGDGNLNLVFIVRGPAGALAVKQALPYVRLAGEGLPLVMRAAERQGPAFAH